MRPALLILVMLCGCCGDLASAAAAEIFVAPAGDDDHSGTANRPLASPQRAIDLAHPGDTVYLRGGTYRLTHFLWIDKPGVTLRPYPGEAVALVAPTTDSSDTVAVVVIAADNVSLQNLEIIGGGHYGVKVDLAGDAPTRDVSIIGCHIHHTGADCIKTVYADRLLIEDCEIGPSGIRDPSNAEGIDSIGSDQVTIRRCDVHDTATNGIYLKGGARNGVVEQCLVEQTGNYAGILLGQHTDEEYMRDGSQYEAIDCVARNNLVRRTGGAGVGTYSGYNVRFEHNTLEDVAQRSQAAFWVVTNRRNVAPRQVRFTDNVVRFSGEQPVVVVKDLADALICDDNRYHSATGRYEFRRERAAGMVFDLWNFDQWRRAMRVDTRSRLGD